MILYTDQLNEIYADYSNPQGKISREVANGNLIPLVRGIYETDAHTDGMYLAGCICRPSYLSFEYALAEYDLIPEGVFSYSSATFRKRKRKCYTNAFGRFYYEDVPDAAYPKGVILHEHDGRACQFASPEKAICDKLYIMPPVRAVRDIEAMLFEDLRVDEDDFWALDAGDLLEYAPLYRSNNLYSLEKLVMRKKR